MWFWLVVISGFVGTGKDLFNRAALKDRGDSLTFSFLYQLVPVVFALPLFAFGLNFPSGVFPYFLLVVIGVVDTFSVFLIMESFKYLDVSLRAIVYQLRLLWVLIISVLILGETLNLAKIIGVFLIFSGISLAIFKKRKLGWFQRIIIRILGKKDRKGKGVLVTLLASLLTALEIVGVKYLLSQFSVSFVIFGTLLVSALIFLFLVPDLKNRTLFLIKGPKRRVVWLTLFLGTVGIFLSLQAMAMTELSRVNPILESFKILTILGGIVFLKERERVWQKILGGILTAVGVILVKGS
jgi:drug/metabolite transporter (DMT)-like permease